MILEYEGFSKSRTMILEEADSISYAYVDVPEEYKNDIQLVTFERKAGFRITGKRGFDIISNSFFVEET